MRKMNRQDVLNKVWRHLRKQGKKCESASGNCLYRGKNGTACGIGGIIPDEIYTRAFENHSASTLMGDPNITFTPSRRFIEASRQFQSLFTKDVSPEFMDGLQYIHDGFGPEGWEDVLTEFAKNENLKPLPKLVR